MTMNQTVFLSLLSLDSYNRGYGANVNALPALGSIGEATIIDIPLPAGSQAAGFYAIAYSWNGNTIISYRGTNPEFSTDSVNWPPDQVRGDEGSVTSSCLRVS